MRLSPAHTLAAVATAAACTFATARGCVVLAPHAKPVRLDAFPAQLVCVDGAGKLVTTDAQGFDSAPFAECFRAHVVPADR